jgi:ATP-dependent helicase/nuclease subunit A
MPSPDEAARERANDRQRIASDPAVSAFVAASAGSGKTKLLTDRLLRLMLADCDPARIQCLTFTKAAAAEMAVRLQRTLGEWVTLDDAGLDDRLAKLNVEPTEARRKQARALFARVLDLPGGMRIGTIHAFCQSLLRRFPLEAQLSPHFRVVEAIDAAIALGAAREAMLAGAHTPERRAALATLAGLVTAQQFGDLVAELRSDRERLLRALALGPEALAAAQRRALGAALDEAGLLARAAMLPDEVRLRAAVRGVAERGSAAVAGRAQRLLDWLGLPPPERAENWAQWCGEFLTAAGAARAASGLVNPKLAKQQPELVETLCAEQQRILAVEDARRAARTAALSAALFTLAAPVAIAYEEGKERTGQLDYDDLIGRTSRLLVDPGAAWVLYKLDGGLDHILLDEVQDVAPAQWRIAGALTAEFFAGLGARDAHRTVFAVGDRKQSIYSFQGADPDAFEDWRGAFARQVAASGETWRDVELDVCFRSTAPVLDLVDAVFADPLAAAGVTEPGALRHYAARASHAGSVELWPLTPPPEVAPPEPWTVPDSNVRLVSAPQRLADGLAAWIKGQTSGGVMLESKGRPLGAGDVLVLVRRRNEFARALVRSLKACNVPVAGLDRLVLTDQPAVADLLALCDTLLLPQDDLALACVLTSPLGGLDDDDLIALAPARRVPLWEVLRLRADERPRWRAARDFIVPLLARVDYASPHALLAEALGPLGGRARLFARLGPEAAEPVDELLNASLVYSQANPPSLQGFLHWLRQSGAEVKREAEGAGGAVRIMTVHGAKGLQAPLVVLPDTTALPPDDGPVMWTYDPASNDVVVPIWAPRRELRCAAAEVLREAARRRREDEHNRLLYVALTRAEDRLVVCGWKPYWEPPEICWYNLVQRGFARLGATVAPFAGVPDAWAESVLRHASAQQASVRVRKEMSAAPVAALPAWAGTAPLWRAAAPPAEPALPVPLAPSRPENADLGAVPQAASPLARRDATGLRFRRGQLVHALLQHLPALPPAERRAAALRFLDRPGHGLAKAAIAPLADEVLAVLDHPGLAPLFGPEGRAEVPLAGVVAGSVIGGLVDRLAVLPDRVLLADYKTNRAPPARPEDVPVLYLRQMAAYRAVLRGVFPGRLVACALVWTTGARVMELPDALLDGHAPGGLTVAAPTPRS